MKRIAVFAAMLMAAIVLAQHGRVAGAYGRGLAVSASGDRGHFALDVRKFTPAPGATPRVEGTFRWSAVTPVAQDRFEIYVRSVRHVEVNLAERTCHFSGPARLVRPTPSGPSAIDGILRCTVVDRHVPGGTGTVRDHIRWEFATATAVVRSFEGAVMEGDIKVFQRDR